LVGMSKEIEMTVDVIVPIRKVDSSTEDFISNWKAHLPIHCLILGEEKHRSLAFYIQRLIDQVETEWFVYLHSDVKLTYGWFEEMRKFQGLYDWFESKSTLVYPDGHRVVMDTQYSLHRAYSGAQMGRTECFRNLRRLEDDYGYRCEDLIFQEWIEEAGFKYGVYAAMTPFSRLRKLGVHKNTFDAEWFEQVYQKLGFIRIRVFYSVYRYIPSRWLPWFSLPEEITAKAQVIH